MDTQQTTVNYTEGLVIRTGTLWLLLGLTVILATVGVFVSALLLIAGIIGFIAILTAWSIGRYNGIELTDTLLRVGRDTLPISDLDPSFGVKDGDEVLTPEKLAKLEIGISSTRKGLKILGGAWGRPKVGYQWVVVRSKNSPDLLLIATLHKDIFMQKMLSSITSI